MLKRASSTRQLKSGLPLAVKWRRDWQMVLLMIPGVLFLLVFFYLPVLGNVVAFQDFQPYLGIMHSEWNGLQNFVNTVMSIGVAGLPLLLAPPRADPSHSDSTNPRADSTALPVTSLIAFAAFTCTLGQGLVWQ